MDVSSGKKHAFRLSKTPGCRCIVDVFCTKNHAHIPVSLFSQGAGQDQVTPSKTKLDKTDAKTPKSLRPPWLELSKKSNQLLNQWVVSHTPQAPLAINNPHRKDQTDRKERRRPQTENSAAASKRLFALQVFVLFALFVSSCQTVELQTKAPNQTITKQMKRQQNLANQSDEVSQKDRDLQDFIKILPSYAMK